MKKLMAIGLAAAMAFGLVGCGGSQSTAASVESGSAEAASESQEETSAENKEAKETGSVEMAGTIDFEISQGIDEYGNKSLMLAYTNNTNHPILIADFMFDFRTDLDDAEKDLLSALQSECTIDDDDLDWAYFRSYNECYTDPGDSSKPSSYTCLTTNTINDPEYCSLADSGTVEITYLNGEKLYTAIYDIDSKAFTSASPKGDAYSWFTSEIGLTIPQIEGCPRIMSSDEEGYGFIYVYNVTLDAFENYAEICKDAGFSNEIYDTGSGSAYTNDDGIELELYFDSNANSMTVIFNK